MEESMNGVEGAAVPPSPPRCCSTCEEELSAQRLKANPGAAQCVSCLESAGDVPMTKMYEQQAGELLIPTFYRKPTSYLQQTMDRLKQSSGFLSLREDN